MSSLASWSYTSKATHWPLLGFDDWGGAPSFGLPVVFDCDYQATNKTMVDAKGQEFTSSQILYTERDSIKPGDRVLIGQFVDPSPITAGAWEVKAIKRSADTFDGKADDWEIIT